MQFVKPPDSAVASLLFDYASIEAATEVLESAKPILELAEKYGYPPDRVDPLLKLYDQKIARSKARASTIFVLTGVAAASLFFGLLYLLYKRRILFFRAKI